MHRVRPMSMTIRILATILCLPGGIRGANVKRNTACNVYGRRIENGHTFTLPWSCHTYTCRAGNYTTSSYRCMRDGLCRPEGDTYNQGCLTFKCGHFNNMFGYDKISEGCSFNGTCVGVGQTYKDGCFIYVCSKTTSGSRETYRTSVKHWGCEKNGKCYSPGNNITDQCQTWTCQNIGGSVGFRNSAPGCMLRGKCLKPGETTKKGCVTYLCQVQNILGTRWSTRVDPVSAKCRDADGYCREPGSTFPYNLDGRRWNRCTCTIEGPSVRYHCS